MSRHLRLDLIGGLSGDMFIGAMLDAFPDMKAGLGHVIEQAGFPGLVSLSVQDHNDGILSGTRVEVCSTEEERNHHHHRHYAEIRDRLQASGLEPETRERSLHIFRLIAEVEAAIHGKRVEEVAFHEVGAWDSIADVVLASHLITEAAADSWSVSAIPVGSGFVETAHGRLPVPAPATARLLEGFRHIDDGIEGERVTPTGAAILKHLSPTERLPSGYVLRGTGYGFGKKVFKGLSNSARVSCYEKGVTEAAWETDQIVRLSFDLDDQTPESIAVAVQRIRSESGVIDVSQQASWGKKGRQGATLSVLASPDSEEAVTARCFVETSTLGIRREVIGRAILRRREVVVEVGGRTCRVKVARRPGGNTAKAEIDDLADLPPEARAAVRRQAESLALAEVEGTH